MRQVAARQPAVLLANHGPVVAATSLDAAVGAIEELEATAKLYLLLQGRATRPLAPPRSRSSRRAIRARSGECNQIGENDRSRERRHLLSSDGGDFRLARKIHEALAGADQAVVIV